MVDGNAKTHFNFNYSLAPEQRLRAENYEEFRWIFTQMLLANNLWDEANDQPLEKCPPYLIINNCDPTIWNLLQGSDGVRKNSQQLWDVIKNEFEKVNPHLKSIAVKNCMLPVSENMDLEQQNSGDALCEGPAAAVYSSCAAHVMYHDTAAREGSHKGAQEFALHGPR